MKYLFALLVLGSVVVLGARFGSSSNQDSTTALASFTKNTPPKPKEFIPPKILDSDTDELLQFNTQISHPYYTSKTEEAYFYAEVKAGTYENPDVSRPPLNLSLVIDRSGSMRGDKLDYVKKAAEFVVSNLTAADYLSIVIYESNVKVLHKASKVTNKNAIIQKIRSIQTAGGTNLSGGLLSGYSEAKSSFDKNYVNRVLLLSDGLANEGITEPSALQEIVSDKNQNEGITLSTFGVGLEFNEDLMLNLAEYGSGNYYFIENPDGIPTIFEKELNGLLRVVAQNLNLKITLPEGLTVKQVLGFEKTMQQEGNIVTFNLRDLSSEETKSLVMILDGFQQKQNVDINSQLDLHFTAENSRSLSLNSAVNMTLTSDEGLVKSSINKAVMEQYTTFYSNYMLSKTMEAVDKRDYESAKNYQASNEFFIQFNDIYVEDSEVFKVQDSLVQQYGQSIDSIKMMNERERKSYQKSSKASNYNVKGKKK